VVTDETLLKLPAAGVAVGLTAQTTLLVLTDRLADDIRQQLPVAAQLLILKKKVLSHCQTSFPMDSCCGSAAAAFLCGISQEVFQQAMAMELNIQDPGQHQPEFVAVQKVHHQIGRQRILLNSSEKKMSASFSPVSWIDLGFEGVELSAPAIRGQATSRHLKTGDWRTIRPVIDRERCCRCRLCFTFCPDGVIALDEEDYPVIDYDHCKGCLICLVQCPGRAIESEIEQTVNEVGDA